MKRTTWTVGQRVMLTQRDQTFGGAVGTVAETAADPHYLIVKLDTAVQTGRIEKNRMVYEATWAVRKKNLLAIETCKECDGVRGWCDIEIDGYGGDFIPCADCAGHGHTGGKEAAALEAYFDAENENRAQARSEQYLSGCR